MCLETPVQWNEVGGEVLTILVALLVVDVALDLAVDSVRPVLHPLEFRPLGVARRFVPFELAAGRRAIAQLLPRTPLGRHEFRREKGT